MAKSKRLGWMLPYMAGFFDGEGYIGIVPLRDPKRRTPHYQLHVKIGQKDRTILNIFQVTFGGSIRKLKNAHGGWWEWRIVSNYATTFLEELLPYLFNKAGEAKLGLEFQKIKRQRGRGYRAGRLGMTDAERALEDAQYILMKELKKRVA